MSNEDDKKQEEKEAGHVGEYAEWKDREEAGPQDPRDSFRKISHITLLMSYDLIDKLRFWEKETLTLSDEDVAKRLPHTVALLEKLRKAYLEFAEVDP
jgi:hypothetical protein